MLQLKAGIGKRRVMMGDGYPKLQHMGQLDPILIQAQGLTQN